MKAKIKELKKEIAKYNKILCEELSNRLYDDNDSEEIKIEKAKKRVAKFAKYSNLIDEKTAELEKLKAIL